MAAVPSTMLPLGTRMPGFRLPDAVSGRTVSSDDFQDAEAVLVMFICRHCPYVKHVRGELARLARDYQPRGVAVVAINANDIDQYPQDGPDGMREEAEEAGYTFPYLFDDSQEIARAYMAACTPDFFLFDRNRELVYRGQLDDSRPSNDRPVTGQDLRAALDTVLEGGAISPEQIPSIGCNIKWKPGNQPPYFG